MDSLVKERRRFKQHLARRKGKISVVKEHRKLIEVNPDKKNKSPIIDINSIMLTVKEVNQNKQSTDENIMNIYKSGINAIYDVGMKKTG